MTQLSDLYQIDDPLELFKRATEALGQHQEDVDKLAAIRAGAIAALYARGYSYKDLALTVGVSAPRIGQLIGSTETAALEVLKAWDRLEYLLRQVTLQTSEIPQDSPYKTAVQVLRASEQFDDQALLDLDSIRVARNHLMHGDMQVSVDTAEDLLDKATYLGALLTLWLRQGSAPSDAPRTPGPSTPRKVTFPSMSTIDQINQKTARLAGDEAALRKRLSESSAVSARSRAEAATKRQQASRTSSRSMASTYLRSAERADRRAVEADKKATDISKKLEDVASKKASLARDLERATKALAKKQESATRQQRSADLTHAREVARIGHSTVRHIHEVRRVEPPKQEKLRVLYLTSNADAENYLRVDIEVREVRQAVRRANHRDLIELDHRPAATPEDLLDGLTQFRPHVLHFSGHGGGRSLLFDGAGLEGDSARSVPFGLLGRAIAASDYAPKLLVLNGCDTVDGAEVFLETVPAIVAMSSDVSDLAATAFAARFYAAIADAQSIGAAVELGAVAVDLLDRQHEWRPVLYMRADINTREFTLVQPAAP